MKIRFELSGPDSERELRSLHTWLRDDRELRREVQIEPVRRQARPGDMGLDLEAVLALLSTIATLGQLPFSYAAWRDGRRPRCETVIYVYGAGPEDLRRVQAAFPDAVVHSAEDEEPEEDGQ